MIIHCLKICRAKHQTSYQTLAGRMSHQLSGLAHPPLLQEAPGLRPSTGRFISQKFLPYTIMAEMKEYSSETDTFMSLEETGHSVRQIIEQWTVSRTSQALVTAVHGGRELFCA